MSAGSLAVVEQWLVAVNRGDDLPSALAAAGLRAGDEVRARRSG